MDTATTALIEALALILLIAFLSWLFTRFD
jgi:flagellar biogenesis protein FliO